MLAGWAAGGGAGAPNGAGGKRASYDYWDAELDRGHVRKTKASKLEARRAKEAGGWLRGGGGKNGGNGARNGAGSGAGRGAAELLPGKKRHRVQGREHTRF